MHEGIQGTPWRLVGIPTTPNVVGGRILQSSDKRLDKCALGFLVPDVDVQHLRPWWSGQQLARTMRRTPRACLVH
jgi:hypothetical protein